MKCSRLTKSGVLVSNREEKQSEEADWPRGADSTCSYLFDQRFGLFVILSVCFCK